MYAVKEIYYTLQGEGMQTGRAAVFCRHQVKQVATLGDCPTCGGWGQLAEGRPCRSCDGTGSRLRREGGE